MKNDSPIVQRNSPHKNDTIDLQEDDDEDNQPYDGVPFTTSANKPQPTIQYNP